MTRFHPAHHDRHITEDAIFPCAMFLAAIVSIAGLVALVVA